MTVTQIKQALAQYREKMTDLDDGICYFDTKSFEGLVRLYASNFSVNETIESLKKAWGLQ
jgi:hypothetical protein